MVDILQLPILCLGFFQCVVRKFFFVMLYCTILGFFKRQPIIPVSTGKFVALLYCMIATSQNENLQLRLIINNNLSKWTSIMVFKGVLNFEITYQNHLQSLIRYLILG
jgi:hypothetical protein